MIVARRSKWTAFLIAAAMILSLLSFVSVSNAAEATDLEWWNFRNNYENNGVTDRQTVDTKEEANLKWGQKYGTGYAAAPTPPIIIDGYLYIASGKKVMKIDRATGECVKSGGDMVANVGYAMNPIVYADGKFFVQVGNGRIQAVDFATLDPVWCSENIGGQTVSPISYKKIDGVGYLYTGTWGGEKADGSFFCITTDDDNVVEGIKQHTWRFKPSENDPALAESEHKKRGFYWAGAYVSENFVAVGSDDGTSEGDYTANGVFYTLDPKTGEIIDRIDQIKGDARSTIVYDNGYMYFNTKGGLLYRTKVDSTGHLSQTSIYDLGGMSTACPVVYNNRLYIGVCGTGGQFDPDAGHHFSVLDVSGDLTTDSLIYDIPIKGYPQAGALLSTGNVNKDYDGDGSPDNRVYVYFTYNANPGGLYYLYDEPDKTTLSSDQYGELFTPPTAMQQYCISTIIADRDGVMYYKNDSSYLMAVEKNSAYLENAVITTDKDASPKWSKDFDMGQLEGYNVKVNTDSTVASMTLTLTEGATATVNGVPYTGSASEVMLSTEGDETAVDVVVTRKGATRTYKFNIVKQGGNSKLSDLRVTLANSYTGSVQTLTPTFSEEATDYETNYITKLQGSAPNNFASIWPVPADTSATVKVFTGDNAKAGKNDTEKNEDGSMKVTATSSGKQRYAIYFANANKDAKVRVEVTSENGRSTTVYKLTLARTIHVASVELDKQSTTIEEGMEEKLTATVKPDDALDKTVTWSSSNESIATVDETGKVTAVATGSATITVTANDGKFADTCDVEVVAHTHDINKVEAKNATCEEPGVKEHFRCSSCGRLFSDQGGDNEISEDDTVDPATGHNWGAPDYAWGEENSTVTAVRICRNDPDHPEQETVEDVLKETIPESCEKNGENIYTAVFKNTAFGTKIKRETIPPHGHDFGGWETVDPSTCIDKGQRMRVCQYDSKHVEYEDIDLSNHDLEKIEAVERSCTTDGNIEHWRCNVCEHLFSSEAGTDEIGQNDVLIPSYGGHDHSVAVEGTAKAATCTEGGNEADMKCSRCDEVEKGKLIDALGHKWDAGKVTKKATETAPGEKTYTCIVCKTTKKESIPKIKPASAPTGKVTILNTIANSAKKTNDVIWDKSKVKGATNYEINWKTRGASKWSSKTVGNTVRGTTTGLKINGLYDVRVRAKNAAGAGAWSNTVYRYFHTTEKIKLSSKSKGSFTINWKKNSQATGYQVMFTTNKNGTGAANNINNVGKSKTSFTKKGLKSGKTYYVQIREIKKVGGVTYVGNISVPIAVKVK